MSGDIKADGTISFSIPRDLTVTLDGIRLNPASDLTSDFDFMKAGDKAMMVGKIALTESEVPGITKKVTDAGLEVTAIHNHLLRQSPRIMWAHIHGYGDPADIAGKLHGVMSTLDGAASKKSTDIVDFKGQGIDTDRLDNIIGHKGKADGDDYGYSIPRADKITMNGHELSPEMDVSTLITFQPLGEGKAAAIGEFVLETAEVEPVLRALADNGVEVTALHSHMLTEEPRLFYLHCWKTGDAMDIAETMHIALERTNSQ